MAFSIFDEQESTTSSEKGEVLEDEKITTEAIAWPQNMKGNITLPPFSKLRGHQTKFSACNLQWTSVNQTQSQHFDCFIQTNCLSDQF